MSAGVACTAGSFTWETAGSCTLDTAGGHFLNLITAHSPNPTTKQLKALHLTANVLNVKALK